MDYLKLFVVFLCLTSIECLDESVINLEESIKAKISNEETEILSAVKSNLISEKPTNPNYLEINRALQKYCEDEEAQDESKNKKLEVIYGEVERLCQRLVADFSEPLDIISSMFLDDKAAEIENNPFYRNWSSYYTICRFMTDVN